MNNCADMIKYMNDKRVFTIIEFMSEFKLSYPEALEFFQPYKKAGNIKQLDDFKFQIVRSILIEPAKKEVSDTKEVKKKNKFRR